MTENREDLCSHGECRDCEAPLTESDQWPEHVIHFFAHGRDPKMLVFDDMIGDFEWDFNNKLNENQSIIRSYP